MTVKAIFFISIALRFLSSLHKKLMMKFSLKSSDLYFIKDSKKLSFCIQTFSGWGSHRLGLMCAIFSKHSQPNHRVVRVGQDGQGMVHLVQIHIYISNRSQHHLTLSQLLFCKSSFWCLLVTKQLVYTSKYFL